MSDTSPPILPKRSVYARYAWPIVAVAALLIAPMLWGVHKAFEGMNNNLRQWLPRNLPATEDYLQFRSVFGADDFAVVSWDGCTLDDERLEQLAEALVPPPDQPRNDETECFSRVVTGPDLLKTLMAEPFELSREEALSRLEGTLVGPDRKTTCAVITLSKIGNTERRGHSRNPRPDHQGLWNNLSFGLRCRTHPS